MLDIEQIKEILPHRAPFLLIDRVDELEVGKRAVATKCVSYNEPFFTGHFPQKAVMPGVLIIEALGQTGAVAILSDEKNKGKIALFGGIKNARFRQMVVPGDVLRLEVDMVNIKGPVGMGKGVAYKNDKICVEAELMFAIHQE